MTQLDPQVNALIAAALAVAQSWEPEVSDPAERERFSAEEHALAAAAKAFLASRHTLRQSEGSRADLESGSAGALRAEEASTAAALDMLDKANRRANRFAEQLGDLGQGLRKRGIRVEPTGFVVAALDHIDRLTTALDEAARDAHVELEAVYDGGLSTDQEIRVTAAELWLTGDCGWKLGDWVVWIRDGRTPDEPEHPIVLDEPRRAANFVAWIDEVAPDFKLTDWQREILQRHGVRVSAEERSDDTKDSSKITEVG